jgi:deazaflavin-dependent oxidoreductase (nitroreductase family)
MSDSPNPTTPQRRAPRWLKLMNRLNQALLRHGIGPRPQHLLSVLGRTSGIPRTTPVAVVEFRGNRYIVAGYAGSDWVRNARHAGWAELRRGRHRQRVALDEVPAEERPPILRAFARQVPGGRAFLTVAANATDEDYANASPHHPVFRLRPDQEGAPRR